MSRRNTKPLNELVPAVAPISVWQIERLAERFLEQYQPDMLCRPEPLDVAGLVAYLPTHQIAISPATAAELGDCEAVTRFDEYPEIEIVLVEEQWRALFDRDDLTHRARATVAHELGHAVMHAEQMHEAAGPKELSLERVPRSEIESFRDPEWQAWAWAGFVLMPRRILVELEDLSPERVSQVYDVSPEMARYHLRLLRRNGLG